jgi:hypothetical protein
MKHTRYECKCNHPYCQFCEGSLFDCTVCGGFEGSLPTDCPGMRMTDEERDQVYAGHIDYREDRGWVVPDGTGTSMGDTDALIAGREAAEKG